MQHIKQEELNQIEQNLNLDKVDEIDEISSKYALILKDYYRVDKKFKEENDSKIIDAWIEKWFIS